MATEIWENRIPYFFENVLKTPAGSIPKGAQWVVAFEDLAGKIMPSIDLALQYEKRGWQIQNAADVVTSDGFQATNGCVFAQAIDLPGESLVVNPEGNIMSNSLLRSYVGQGRDQFPKMRMTFLETNASFVDNFLRPWVIATGTFGLFARDISDPKNYRTNLVCYKIGAYSPQQPPIPLMKIVFYDLCCVEVSNEEYNYAPVAGQAIMREAQFVYNHYTIDTSLGRIFQDSSNPNAGKADQAMESRNNLANKLSTLPPNNASTAIRNRGPIRVENKIVPPSPPAQSSSSNKFGTKTQDQVNKVKKPSPIAPVNNKLTKTPVPTRPNIKNQDTLANKVIKTKQRSSNFNSNQFETKVEQQEDSAKGQNQA